MSTTETIRRGTSTTPKDRGLPRLRLLFTPHVGQSDPAARRSFTLPVGITRIGRELDDESGIELSTDKRTSREHAHIEISTSDRSVRIIDCGSKNGTSINGIPLPPSGRQPLRDGDVVRIGDSFLLLRHEPARPPDREIPSLVGVSPAMSTLRHQVGKLAAERATILIQGETGTGKEVVASALHELSRRSGARIAVNCSAVPENLAESLFFGHTANAFTNARAHPGFFRAAHRGTLFLDEVGDIPQGLAAKLLRALEDRSITPIGANEALPCDVRLVAATNRDLLHEIAAGRFREDLYARLAEIVLHLVPLRERREDILLLLDHASPRGLPELPADFIETLLLYAWPRNVREVFKIAEHIRLFGADEALRARLREPPRALADATPSTEAPRVHRLKTPTREELIALLEKHGGVFDYIARELSCSRRQVGRWIETYKLDRELYRSRS